MKRQKVILLIILVLLFLIISFIIGYKLGRINIPSYNIEPDIFEINEIENSSSDDNDLDNSFNDNIVNDTEKNTTIKSSNNKLSDNVITNDNSLNDEFGFSVSDENVNWNSTQSINIFKNLYFNNESIIAPGVSNVYEFVIKNNTNYNVSYNVIMSETNYYNINMKYRLKKNDTYIIGNNNTWVDAKMLNLNNQLLKISDTDKYALEWQWFDSDNDNEIGKIDGSDYSLAIAITAVDTGE